MRKSSGLLFIILAFLINSCTTTFRHPFKPAPARIGEFSDVHKKELSKLPLPAEKVFAAVYNFRDQTGQYKLMENSASWSTVVTQGATSVLMQSLEESGWFTTIEREGLSNLLNERRIIRQTQEQFQGSGSLPPLLYAGVIIEGGIIAYESNIRTGGAGARYFGTGGSGEYREDQVTIYLRAVSTSNGRILKTVHASKTILSQKLDMGVFRFVSLKKLLEAETGYTYNEPSFVAVQEAIDKAVTALIIEGIDEKLWGLKNADDINSNIIQEYYKEKELAYQTDYLGNVYIEKDKNFSVGIEGSGVLYDGDYAEGVLKPAASVSLGFWRKKPFSLNFNLGVGQASNQGNFKTNFTTASLNVQYNVYNQFYNTPYFLAGYGVNYQTRNKWFDRDMVWNKNTFQYLNLGVGYQWQLKKLPLVINTSVTGHVFLDDDFDQMIYGSLNDRLWFFNVGLQYHFNWRKENGE